MSAPKLCKFGCGRELTWNTSKSKFVESDGTEHTTDRCKSFQKKPDTPSSSNRQSGNKDAGSTDPMLELSQAIRELTAAIRAGRMSA